MDIVHVVGITAGKESFYNWNISLLFSFKVALDAVGKPDALSG